MGRLAQISTEEKREPFRVLIYGIEGVGKSQFGAHAPNPVFISPEGGTGHLKTRDGKRVPVMPNVKTFSDIQESIRELIEEKHDFETVVLDSADWTEKVCHTEIIGTSRKDIIRVNGGYGSGYRESEARHKGLIDDLAVLREKRGMNVIITAHYHVRTVKDPEAVADYDAFEIKCHEYVSSLWREWVDATLFARFETLVKAGDDDDKTIATGTGRRVMFTQKRPAFQAKNRYNLPFEMPVSFAAFEKALTAFYGNSESVDDIRAELDSLAGAMDPEASTRMLAAVKKAGDNKAELAKIRNYARTKVQA